MIKIRATGTWVGIGVHRVLVTVSLVWVFLSDVTVIGDEAIFSTWDSFQNFI